MQPRASYSDLKVGFLDVYFEMCGARGFYRKWTFDKMILHAHDDFVQNYASPIETLMVDVIGLTLTGGWFPELESYYRKRIEETLSGQDLRTVLASLPKGEAEELLRDLKALDLA